jgi:hypothetical protein
VKIRIGDRVRLKNEGDWGTVVNCREWGHIGRRRTVLMCLIRLDAFAGVWVNRTKRQLEKLPRYRGFPEARDMVTAMRHLQEYLR